MVGRDALAVLERELPPNVRTALAQAGVELFIVDADAAADVLMDLGRARSYSDDASDEEDFDEDNECAAAMARTAVLHAAALALLCDECTVAQLLPHLRRHLALSASANHKGEPAPPVDTLEDVGNVFFIY